MSYIVLHMDKFKKEAVRGIQHHNRRERESSSNPDIDYERSDHNFDLCENAAEDYAQSRTALTTSCWSRRSGRMPCICAA